MKILPFKAEEFFQNQDQEDSPFYLIVEENQGTTYTLLGNDFNNDGFCDLAIGTPGETILGSDSQYETIYVFFGGKKYDDKDIIKSLESNNINFVESESLAEFLTFSDNSSELLPENQIPIIAIDGTVEDDILMGDKQDNLIRGFQGDDLLAGKRGKDTLIGGQGDDFLLGGRGNDILRGNRGEDTLKGGFGNDILVGGADADIFVLEITEGIDRIRDFNDGVDKLGLIGSLTFADLQINDNPTGTATIIQDNSNKTIAILQGIEANLINESDFIEFIY